MKKNEKELYVAPTIMVVAVEANSLMGISGEGKDFPWGAPKRNLDLDEYDDWDEDEVESESEQRFGFSLINKK